MTTRAGAAVFVLWMAAAAAAAGEAARTPVILVPGVTGSELRHVDDGRPAWGVGRNLILPRDGGYGLALPVVGDRSGSLEVGEVIERVRLFGLFRSEVYRPIVEAFEGAGYRRGDLDRPAAADSLFLFAYDWRDDNVRSALQLAQAIERVRLARGVERVDVDLVCQSGGAHICRYLAKYGAVSLEEAEAGRRAAGAFRIARMVLVGTSNGGSLRILREMIRGRRYVPLVGRRWRPEVLFTFPGLYQDLPASASDLFLDTEGERVDADLYDPETWRRFGWSAFDRRGEARMVRSAEIFGSSDDRLRFLGEMLERATRFRALVAADVGFDAVCRLHMIQSTETDTPVRAVVRGVRQAWRTHFVGDRFVKRRPRLLDQVAEPGDGHASVASQSMLSASELEKMPTSPRYVSGSHFRMILAPETMRGLVDALTPAAEAICREALPQGARPFDP